MDYEKLMEDIRMVVRQEMRSDVYSKKVLTIKEASQFTRLAVSTLYSLVSDRKIPFVKPAGKVLFMAEDLMHWMKSKQSTVVSDNRISIGSKKVMIK